EVSINRTVGFCFWIERPVGYVFHQCGIVRNGGKYRLQSDSLELCTEGLVTMADCIFELLLIFLQLLNSFAKVLRRLLLRTLQCGSRQLGCSFLELVEQRLIFRTRMTAQSGQTVGHGIEHAPLAL